MCLWKDPAALEEAANMARHCASMVPGEPHLVALVEEAGSDPLLYFQHAQKHGAMDEVVLSVGFQKVDWFEGERLW